MSDDVREIVRDGNQAYTMCGPVHRIPNGCHVEALNWKHISLRPGGVMVLMDKKPHRRLRVSRLDVELAPCDPDYAFVSMLPKINRLINACDPLPMWGNALRVYWTVMDAIRDCRLIGDLSSKNRRFVLKIAMLELQRQAAEAKA